MHSNNLVAVCQWCLPDKSKNCFALAKSLGFDAVEMDMGFNDERFDLRSDLVLAEYLTAQKESQMPVTSLALNHLKINDPAAHDAAKAIIDRAIAVVCALGGKALQVPSFWDGGMRTPKELEASALMLKYACIKAKPHGIIIASENQLSARENLRLIETVAEDNFAIYFDTANPYLFDRRDGLELLKTLLPHIAETHLKDYTLSDGKCVPLGNGDCHTEEAVNMFLEFGYQGAFVLENSLDAGSLAADARYIRSLI